MSEQPVTVLVIGGGPGGSTAAAMLAKGGLKVLLLEREHFPRYHIGESLLASCVPTLKLSGAYDAVAAAGFTLKRGGLFHWAADVFVLDWTKLVDPNAFSWQVDRAKYDDILLRNAARQGAEVVEGASVKRIVFDGDRPVAAEWTLDTDPLNTRTVRFDYLIDASGRSGILAQQHFKSREQHKIFQNVAVWAYWEGAKLLPDSPEGAINVVSSADGWWWNIPLAQDRYSVGFVTHKTNFAKDKQAHASLQEYYLERVRSTPLIKTVTDGAKFTAPVMAEQDYSYVSNKFCGPGYMLVGDAACFLDPLLSTGVHLAQYGAMLASACVLSTARGEVTESEANGFYEYVYRRAYARLLVLVSRLYQSYSGKDDYFWGAQKLVHEVARHQEPAASFTDIIAGMADMREVSSVDTRELNYKIMLEEQAAQDYKAATKKTNLGLHSLDVSSVWGPWHSLTGKDTSTEELYLIVEPGLTLARRKKAPAT